ncbi:hypothetical protein CHKEEEPN_1501 [Methylorubrum podarium]|nr:hypothetical protein CHKEEEPN_1501 [Methylorubrum podarium]
MKRVVSSLAPVPTVTAVDRPSSVRLVAPAPLARPPVLPSMFGLDRSGLSTAFRALPVMS